MFEPLVDTYVEAGLDVQVVQLIKAAEDYFFKDWVLQNVVCSYAVEKKYDQAVEFVEMIEDEYSKASALSSLAGEYLRNGQKDKVLAILAQALQLSEMINDAEPKAWAL